jgi:phosphate transport system protein
MSDMANIDPKDLTHASRPGFDSALAEIKDDVLRMGMLVEGQIHAAIAAFANHDAEGALKVIKTDTQINQLQRHATSAIADVIALQSPVARDLRYLLTLDHVSYELERMGDHAASVAKQAQRMAPFPHLKDDGEIPELGRLVADQVKEIIRTLVDSNVDAARDVARRDDEVDAIYRRIFEQVLKAMREDPEKIETGTGALFAGHYLERIGDRVTNIAEDIVFLSSGEVEDLNP